MEKIHVPLLFTGAEYDTLAKGVVNEWKQALIRTHGPTAPAAFRDWMRERKKGLYNSKGLSDSGELQEAFVLPQYIENKIAYVTGEPDWPRTMPKLLRAVYDEFNVGAMGSYTGNGRDFGLALGSGDRD